MQVDDDRVVIGDRQRIQHFFAAIHADHLVAGLLQQPLHHHPVGLVVVGNQDLQAAHPCAVAAERVGERNDVLGGGGLVFDPGRHDVGGNLLDCVEREIDPETAAALLGTFETDAAAHRLGESLGDGRAQPGTAIATGHADVGLLECLEQAGAHARWDADAGVGDREAQVCPGIRTFDHRHAQGNRARVGELDCVAGEVEQHLAQVTDIAAQALRYVLGYLDLVIEVLGAGLRQQDHANAGHQLARLELDDLQLQFAGLDGRDVEHVLDQRQHAAGRRLDGGQALALLTVELGGCQQL